MISVQLSQKQKKHLLTIQKIIIMMAYLIFTKLYAVTIIIWETWKMASFIVKWRFDWQKVSQSKKAYTTRITTRGKMNFSKKKACSMPIIGLDDSMLLPGITIMHLLIIKKLRITISKT